MQLSIDNLGLTPISPVAPLTEAVRTVFSKYGSNAHLYIAGPNGLPINGFQPGNYFDSAGTTHASVDGSVGAVLDAAGSVGAELINSGAWTLTQPTSGSVTNVAGTITVNTTDGTYAAAKQGASKINATYRFSGIASGLSGGGIAVSIGAASYVPAAGPFSCVLVAPSISPFEVKRANGVGAGTIVGLTVKQVTGIHATQSTPGFKPTLRKGIVNLLTYSNDLTGSGGWFPNGAEVTKQGDECVISSVGNDPMVFKGFDVVAGRGYTLAVKVKAVGATIGKPAELWNYMAGSATGPVVSNIFTLGSDYEIQVVNFTPTGSGSVYFRFDAPSSSAIAGDTVYVDGCGLFAGTLTAAQILAAGGIPMTTTAPASSQAGVNYLEFDGVDDRLSLSGPLFQLADDWCVVAAVSDVGNIVWNTIFSQAHQSLPARIQFFIEGGRAKAYVRDDNYVAEMIDAGVPIGSAVAVVSIVKRGSAWAIRVNGVERSNAILAAFGEATFTLATIGSFNGSGTGDFFKGRIYSVAPEKGTFSDADVQLLEKQAAAAAGIQL